MASCWFREFAATQCSGRLQLCHLLTKDRLRQEFPEGAVWLDDHFVAVSALDYRRGRLARVRVVELAPDEPGDPPLVRRASLRELQRDPRLAVVGCVHHHAQFDSYALKVPRGRIPALTREAARELGLGVFLDLDRRFA